MRAWPVGSTRSRARRAAIAVGLVSVLAAAPVGADDGRLPVRRWGVEDGLPQTSVSSIAKDERGFLWVATFGGLARFDGRTFQRVDPPSADLDGHRFTAVAVRGDRIWVGTERGRVFRLDLDGREPPREFPIADSDDAPIWQLTVDGDRVLVAASRAGTWEIVDDRPRRLEDTVLDTHLLVRDRAGTLWAAGIDSVRCIGPGCVPIPVDHPSALSVQGGEVQVLAAGGRYRIRDGAAVPEPGAARLDIGDLVHDGWIPTQFARLDLQLGDSRDVVTGMRAVLVDGPGALWLGSDREGLVRIHERAGAVFPLPSTRGVAAALALPLPDGSVLTAGYCAGLFRMRPTAAGGLLPQVLLGGQECVSAMAIDPAGGAWLGITPTEHVFGLWHLGVDDVLAEIEVEGGFTGDIKTIRVDGDDRLWLGTGDGLVRAVRAGAGFRVERRWTTEDGLPHRRVFALADDGSGGLLVGTAAGAVRVRGDRVTPLAVDGDRRTPVRDLVVRGDAVWLATYGDGIGRIGLTGPGAGQARWLSAADGFCSNNVSRLIDHGDRAWINTNEGVVVATWLELEALALGRGRLPCDRHDTGEGNGGGEVAGGVMADGRLVFPGQVGLSVLPPIPPPRAPVPATFIAAATIDGRPLALGRRTTIPPGRRDLRLELSSPLFDLDPGESPRFETVITRGGREVLREVTGRTATFLGLAPGSYVLRVQRVTARGNGPGALLRFRLARAWSETTAARVGIPAALSAFVGLLVWLWVRTLRTRARALEAELAEHGRAEAARRERDMLHQTVFERSPGPLFLLTCDGAVHELNSAARALLGLAEATTPALELEGDDERERWQALLAAARSAPASDELVMRAGDGRARRVRFNIGALDLDGRPFLLAAAHDVTAEREEEARRSALQSQAADRDRLEAIGRLAGGVAHDVNNVLAVFQALIDEARGQVSEPQRMRACLAELEVAVRSGRDVTSRFLGFGKDAGAPTPVVLDEVVPASRRLLARLLAPGAELVVDCGAPGAWVRVVPGHLDRVLFNLVVNASDALGGEPGEIRIRTRALAAAPAGGVTVVAAPAGPLVELTVEDTGCGMDEVTRRRAFDPFFSTKDAKGTGLGLSVVYNVVTAVGGGLVVDSAPGRGSRFTVLLPQIEAPAASALRAGKHTVMVCDDNPLVRTGTGRLFRSAGWQVVEAEDGADALSRLAEQPADLVVTDQHMPRIDGVGLVSALRRQARTTPVILVSGDPLDASTRLGDELPANVRVVGKPFPAAELLALAAAMVDGPPDSP